MAIITIAEMLDYLENKEDPKRTEFILRLEKLCDEIGEHCATVAHANYGYSDTWTGETGGTAAHFTDNDDTDQKFKEMCDPSGWDD